jgi:hypothetical protein
MSSVSHGGHLLVTMNVALSLQLNTYTTVNRTDSATLQSSVKNTGAAEVID